MPTLLSGCHSLLYVPEMPALSILSILTMLPKAVGGRGHGANCGRSVRRVRLADVGRPRRDPIVATPPPEEVADQELPEGGDEHDVTVSHDVVLGAYSTVAPPPPVPLVATVAPPVPPIGALPIAPTDAPPIPLEAPAIPFQLNTDLDKWLKRVIKVFDLMKLTNADRMDNIHGLLQGKADSWFNGIRHRIGADLTWDRFVIEFCQEYLIESYRKGKQDAFFRLFQGSLSVREYVDRFKDIYGFVLNILPSKEAKCDRFRQGLHVGIRSSMTWFIGHFKRDCPLLVTKDNGFGYGSVTPQNPQIGTTPARGKPTMRPRERLLGQSSA
ncbi:hypothetical protein GH714_015118 [Hevea brasiliensis]|uniref:Retrotransposon gag domain-containing protein n=1 Tax=Hevea brasiliensis TaxID=3981 RepID=A0A6A6KVI0_HEVBR|nr:hypothetical protein GH714_015118 [Hevea brasiliensis]